MSAIARVSPQPGVIEPSGNAEAVERKMLRLLSEHSGQDDPLRVAFSDHLESGGKRTRAIVCLSSAHLLGLAQADGLALAAAVELLHNASLIQDDLQDRSALRRGRPAVWQAFGTDTAIGLTDLAISASFRALAELSPTDRIPHLLKSLHRAIAVTLQGQGEDLAAGTDTVASAISTARRKSGPLFALSLELPLIAAGYEARVDPAREAAECLGVGYQICDDLNDVEEDRQRGTSGNLVLVLENILSRDEAFDEAARLARTYLDRAVSSAEGLPRGCGEALIALTESLAQRLPCHTDG
jgi:geranylgeranyl pyrophosphate synthase